MTHAYRKEIILVILLKMVMLAMLWEVCFSHDNASPLSPVQMRAQLLQASAASLNCQ